MSVRRMSLHTSRGKSGPFQQVPRSRSIVRLYSWEVGVLICGSTPVSDKPQLEVQARLPVLVLMEPNGLGNVNAGTPAVMMLVAESDVPNTPPPAKLSCTEVMRIP